MEQAKKFSGKAKNQGIVNQAGRDIIQVNYNYFDDCWNKIDNIFLDKHKYLKTNSVFEFILGASCKWGLIMNNKTVPREIVHELVSAIETYPVQAVLGAGGEGKTTILMQTAYKLFQEGWTVYYHRGNKINLPSFEITDINKTIFIIDDIVSVKGFDNFLSEIKDSEYKMLFSSRSNEWATYCENKNIDTRDIHYIETKSIEEKEADQFAMYIKNNNITQTSKDEIKDIFLRKNNGFLYSAMLCSVYGKNLQEIAKSIVNRIYYQDKDIAKVLACLCLIEETGYKMNYNIYKKIYKYFSIPKYKIVNCLSKEVKVINNNYVETRHPMISSLFRKHLYEIENAYFDKFEIWDFIFNLYCDPMVNEKTDKSNFENIRKSMVKICIDENFYEDNDLLRLLIDKSISQEIMLIFVNHIKRTAYEDTCRFVKQILTYDKYKRSDKLWEILAKKEIENGNIGNILEENSARWILNQGIQNCSKSSSLWFLWINLEVIQENVGEAKKEYTARWLFKEYVEKCNNNFFVWLAWANFEVRFGNIGDIAKENSARWIFRQSSDKFYNVFKLWLAWSRLESTIGNIGDVNKEYSARWLLKKGTENCKNDFNIWYVWGNLEIEQGNVGEITKEYTARWIFKTCIEEHCNDFHLWVAWIKLEIQQNNLGDINKEYSARWLFLNAYKKCPGFADFWESHSVSSGKSSLFKTTKIFKNTL